MKKTDSQTYESSRGKFHVGIYHGKTTVSIQSGEEKAPFFFVDTTENLVDLFVAIASVLNQVYNDDSFPTKSSIKQTDGSPSKETKDK